jgi:uncharacterized protein YjbI with pentapeptide repeats
MKRNFPSLFIALILALATPLAPLFAGDRDYHDQDLKNKDFSQAILNGADFTDAVVSHANFYGASLKNAIFKGCDLDSSSFASADATGADLHGSKGLLMISSSHFDKANMEGITMMAHDTTFRGTNLKGAKLNGYIYNCDFSGADLRGANMRQMVVNTDSNRWKGVIYNDDTAWPDGFDPVAAGAVMAKAEAAK